MTRIATAAEIVFWASAALILYAYFLYPAVLFWLYAFTQALRDLKFLVTRKDRRVRAAKPERLPSVSIVIPAHNEEAVLPDKIVNLQRLTYPAELVEIIFVSDGSTDGTNEILRGATVPNMRCVFLEQRQGKANALNCGVAEARNEILVLSDASTQLAPDVIHKLVRHFENENTGAVCGALQFDGSTESRQTEGVYWMYESMLRLMEARLGATLTASGAIYAVRRNCYRPIPTSTILDDLMVPMNVRRMGYSVVYDPEAVAYEVAAETVGGEFKRRVRIAIGSALALLQLFRYPLNPFTAFAFLSHKVLRWVVPLLQITLFASSLVLCTRPLFGFALAAQVLFYSMALVGVFFRERLVGIRFALVPYFLTAMNAAFLVGFVKFASGRYASSWEKAT